MNQRYQFRNKINELAREDNKPRNAFNRKAKYRKLTSALTQALNAGKYVSARSCLVIIASNQKRICPSASSNEYAAKCLHTAATFKYFGAGGDGGISVDGNAGAGAGAPYCIPLT